MQPPNSGARVEKESRTDLLNKTHIYTFDPAVKSRKDVRLSGHRCTTLWDGMLRNQLTLPPFHGL